MTLKEILASRDKEYQRELQLILEMSESYKQSLLRKGFKELRLSLPLDTTIKLQSINICPLLFLI